jgi:hypothetical protein
MDEINNEITKSRSTRSWVLLIIFIILLVFVVFKVYGREFSISSLTGSTTKILFRSHRIPYIPNNMQLKDKDNKISRHLKFRFVYTCSAEHFNLIAKSSRQINNVRELFSFKKNGDLWVGLFVVESEEIELPSYVAEEVIEYPYKLYDTYVMGETRIFGDIEDILINQGYDRDAYGDKSISTTYLNEICSNKMEYIRYFLRHGLMLGTWIKPYRKNNTNTYPGKYVKAPYSSRSACAALDKIDSELCYLTDGVIVQEENKMLGKYELKCYVIDGKVTMNIVRLNGKNFNVCVPDDYGGVSPDVKEVIEKYKNEIEETCLKTYYYTNALINMRVQKLENDTREAEEIMADLHQTIEGDSRYTQLSDHEYARIKYILTGLVNTVKEELIDSLNTIYNKSYDVGKFTRRVVDYPDPLDKVKELLAYRYKSDKVQDLDKLEKIMSDIKIYDRFMRVDMALPDIDESSVYDKITVTEIEPLASGIYLYKTIGACMKDDDMNTFDNIVKYNLYSIISTIDHNASQKEVSNVDVDE